MCCVCGFRCDRQILPFESLIKYEPAVVRIPAARAAHTLAILSNFSTAEIDSKRSAVRALGRMLASRFQEGDNPAVTLPTSDGDSAAVAARFCGWRLMYVELNAIASVHSYFATGAPMPATGSPRAHTAVAAAPVERNSDSPISRVPGRGALPCIIAVIALLAANA